MKLLQKISIFFLGLVSLEYVVLGTLALLGLIFKSESLYLLAALISWFGLVVPLAISDYNGTLALCFSPKCNLDSPDIFQAQLTIAILSFLAIAGGVISFFATIFMWRNKDRISYYIWAVFVALSITVALWNLKCFFLDSYYTNHLIGTMSSFWALLYTGTYILTKYPRTK